MQTVTTTVITLPSQVQSEFEYEIDRRRLCDRRDDAPPVARAAKLAINEVSLVYSINQSRPKSI